VASAGKVVEVGAVAADVSAWGRVERSWCGSSPPGSGVIRGSSPTPPRPTSGTARR